MPARVFRRPQQWFPAKFDEWREVREEAGSVVIFFGSSESWPPAVRKRSESKPASFDEECAATIRRGFVEVDAAGKRLTAEPESEVLRRFDALDPYARFRALLAQLRTTKEPALTLERLRSTLSAIESDLDEHDAPFPGPEDVPPDYGALRAYQARVRRLLEKLAAGLTLSAEDRDFESPVE